jgi:predicted Zn-dependent protease
MRAVALMMMAAGVLLIAGCENPLELDRDTEIAIGRDGAAQLEAEHGVVKDAAMQARLERIARPIAAASDEPTFPWTFKILNSDEVNALALPGGFIYMMKGMMDYARDDEQLAGVVAHEVVHAARHHAKEGIERAMGQALLVELVTQRSSDTVRQAARIAIELELREGYRDKEYESDRYGTLYAYRAGHRADGLRQLLARLHEEKGDPARITWVLQSHPPLSKRIGRLDEYIPTLTGGGGG